MQKILGSVAVTIRAASVRVVTKAPSVTVRAATGLIDVEIAG